MSDKLQLTTQPTAEVEKKLAAHKKNITAYANGVTRSGAQLFGYAFMAGREMNLAADILPHGQLIPWLTENFPDVPRPTAHRWRDFASAIGEKLGSVSNYKPLLLKKTFNKKEQAEILSAVPEIMDGQTMVEFMRAGKFLKEPELVGGLNPSVDTVQEFLREKFPDLVGKAYAELPAHVKAQIRKQVLGRKRKPNAQDQIKAANETVQTRIGFLTQWTADTAPLDACDRATLKELEEARLALGRVISSALEKRK
jgi:hypothetical protein